MPQVAAAIALMYSVDTTLTPARVDIMLANGELTDDRGLLGMMMHSDGVN